jgi:hypothetical protein
MALDDEIKQLKAAREEMELLQKATDLTARDLNRNLGTSLKYAKDITVQQRALNKLGEENSKQLQKVKALLRSGVSPEQKKVLKAEKDKLKEQEKYIKNNTLVLNALKKQVSLTQGLANSIKDVGNKITDGVTNQMMSLPSYILEAQKSFLKMNLELGASGANAERLRDALIDSSGHAANLGINFKELAEIQTQFANSIGRMSGANGAELNALAEIAAGTGKGGQFAAEMAANYESIGINAVRSAEMMGDVLNQSEQMGVIGGKALDDINKNFARAQGFTFSKGVKGFQEMAMYAQKTKIAIEDVFNVADKARTLEGSLEMASRLMVMGGNFAKTDPFQLSFLARNKPEELQKKLAEMTKGIARFNRETGELEVGAADMDRLREVADATGMSLESLKESAKQAARNAMVNKNLFVGSPQDREFIAQMAKIGKNGRMSIEVGGKDIDVSKLTTQQIGLLRQQEKTLQQRAKDSQSFDEVWTNFVEELKSTALPLAKHLDTLTKHLTSIIDVFRSDDGGLNTLAYTLLAVVGGLKLVMFSGQVAAFVAGLKESASSFLAMFKKSGGTNAVGNTLAGATGGGTSPTPSGKGGGLGKLLGGTGAGTIAAIGVAFVGLGYGIKLATEGIAQLAEAMKGMSIGEIAGLVLTVGILTAGFVGLGLSLASMGANPLTWAGAGLLALVATSVLGMGIGIKLATDGIANMATSLKGLQNMDFSGLNGMFLNASNFLNGDSSNIDKLKETIAMLGATESKVLSEIKSLLSKPLKMEIAGTDKLNIHVDITTMIDSDVLVKKTARKFALQLKNYKDGKN